MSKLLVANEGRFSGCNFRKEWKVTRARLLSLGRFSNLSRDNKN